jgi:hypothetical protein
MYSSFFFQQSSVFTSTEGWQILLGLQIFVVIYLPWDMNEALSARGVAIVEYWGRGGAARAASKGNVIRAKLNDADAVVVKVCDRHDAEAEAMNHFVK